MKSSEIYLVIFNVLINVRKNIKIKLLILKNQAINNNIILFVLYEMC